MSSPEDLFEQFKADAHEGLNDLDADAALQNWRQQRDAFVGRAAERWAAGFGALELHIALCAFAAGTFRDRYRRKPDLDKDEQLDVLRRIQARGCSTAHEILLLMKNGYTDGALARWRTLHELAVSARLVMIKGREAAIDYRLAALIAAHDAMKEYRKCDHRQGVHPITQQEYVAARRAVDQELAKYGRKRADYKTKKGIPSWYARFNKENPSFPNLQKEAGLKHWRHDYKWACQDVHVGYREVRADLLEGSADELVFAIALSDEGVIDVADITVLMLLIVTSTLLAARINDLDDELSEHSLLWVSTLAASAERTRDAFRGCEKNAANA